MTEPTRLTDVQLIQLAGPGFCPTEKAWRRAAAELIERRRQMAVMTTLIPRMREILSLNLSFTARGTMTGDTLRDLISILDPPATTEERTSRHTTCKKVVHKGRGYLHDADDDRPYFDDGLKYCGRCHEWMAE